MANEISRQRYRITGHNEDSPGRVRHFVRAVNADGSNRDMPMAGNAADIITDRPTILADDTIIEVTTSYEVLTNV